MKQPSEAANTASGMEPEGENPAQAGVSAKPTARSAGRRPFLARERSP